MQLSILASTFPFFVGVSLFCREFSERILSAAEKADFKMEIY